MVLERVDGEVVNSIRDVEERRREGLRACVEVPNGVKCLAEVQRDEGDTWLDGQVGGRHVV